MGLYTVQASKFPFTFKPVEMFRNIEQVNRSCSSFLRYVKNFHEVLWNTGTLIVVPMEIWHQCMYKASFSFVQHDGKKQEKLAKLEFKRHLQLNILRETFKIGKQTASAHDPTLNFEFLSRVEEVTQVYNEFCSIHNEVVSLISSDQESSVQDAIRQTADKHYNSINAIEMQIAAQPTAAAANNSHVHTASTNVQLPNISIPHFDATTYYNEITSLKPLQKQCFTELRHLIDTFSENIAALKQHWDFLLFNMLLQKLDTNTKTTFEMEYSATDIPTYENLMHFLNNRYRALESSHFMTWHGDKSQPSCQRKT
nr:unnamed protein product [Callosobruchus analis]